jgi:hypothetical protein
MGGELHIKNISNISITKFKDSYDLSFVGDEGFFHLIDIKDLPYLLIKAMNGIVDLEKPMPKINISSETCKTLDKEII